MLTENTLGEGGRPQINTPTKTPELFKFSDKLNTQFLEETYGDNLDFGLTMFNLFLSSIEDEIKMLKESLSTSDYLKIKEVAHKIKNNFTWVGIPSLSNLMYELEVSASTKDPKVIGLMSQLETNFKPFHQVLKEEATRLNNFLNS